MKSPIRPSLVFTFAVAIAGCGSVATPAQKTGATDQAPLRRAAAEIELFDVHDDTDAASAPPGGTTDPVRLAAQSDDERRVTVFLVNQSANGFEIETQDNKPLVSVEVFAVDSNRWIHVWELDPSRCGNAEGAVIVRPGRALVATLRSTSGAAPVRARFTLGALSSNEVLWPVSPDLIDAMAKLPKRPTPSSR
jgi:hypothetical protein